MLSGALFDNRRFFKVPEEIQRPDGSKTLGENDAREVQDRLEEEAVEDIVSIEVLLSLRISGLVLAHVVADIGIDKKYT
jgi:hypothetical protein